MECRQSGNAAHCGAMRRIAVRYENQEAVLKEFWNEGDFFSGKVASMGGGAYWGGCGC